MNVYVTGYQRSGNNWLALLIGETIGGSVSCVVRRDQEVRKHRVIQVHHEAEMLQTRSPVVHIVRDPRDIAVSVLDYFPKYYQSIREVLESMHLGTVMLGVPWVRMVESWLGKAVILRYEDLMRDPERWLLWMFENLRVGVFRKEVETAVSSCQYRKIKYLYPGHVHGGESGKWRQYFSDQDNELALDYFGKTMEKLWHL